VYDRFGKRLFDLVLVLPVFIILAPVLVMLGMFVLCLLGSPVFFSQRRPGLQGRPFTLLKFRTMTDARDENERLLPDAKRLNVFGRFLRRTSLDELPELINVFKGEMSFVGPRPLLMEYLDRYTEEQGRRHEVKPGVTGWAQVNGRNALSWEKKFELDVWYVDHVSLGLDLKILAMTAWQLFRPQGIAAEGYATMPEFMGSGDDAGPRGDEE
jgi:sugar transferase EpsL